LQLGFKLGVLVFGAFIGLTALAYYRGVALVYEGDETPVTVALSLVASASSSRCDRFRGSKSGNAESGDLDLAETFFKSPRTYPCASTHHL
jgi:hypothetical protein